MKGGEDHHYKLLQEMRQKEAISIIISEPSPKLISHLVKFAFL